MDGKPDRAKLSRESESNRRYPPPPSFRLGGTSTRPASARLRRGRQDGVASSERPTVIHRRYRFAVAPAPATTARSLIHRKQLMIRAYGSDSEVMPGYWGIANVRRN